MTQSSWLLEGKELKNEMELGGTWCFRENRAVLQSSDGPGPGWMKDKEGKVPFNNFRTIGNVWILVQPFQESSTHRREGVSLRPQGKMQRMGSGVWWLELGWELSSVPWWLPDGDTKRLWICLWGQK